MYYLKSKVKRSIKRAVEGFPTLTARAYPTVNVSDTAAPVPASAKPKLAERVVADIEARIERAGLPAGSRLGTEPELIAHYGVSRETLRTAIRQLERHGVVTMRRGGGGGGGGLVVADTPARTAIHAITAHLELSDTSWSEIVEARALIDVEAAALASRRVDQAGAAQLTELAGRLDHGAQTVRAIAERQLALVGAIAGIAANPVLTLFSAALSDWTFDVLPSVLGTPLQQATETRRTNHILTALVDSVIRGDAEGARLASEQFSESSIKVSRLLEKRRVQMAADDWFKSSSDERGKLAQRLALALGRDVAARGWPDARFGAEAELLVRFGVSRATWREAIRLLEMHGIALPRRGRGGGLMIGRPNPAYTIDSAKRYLRRARLDTSDYLSVRGALESGAIRLAITRASDTEMQALKTLMERVEQADDAAITEFAIAWHNQLSRLGHNRALSLLLGILFALTEQPQDRLPTEISQTLRIRHGRMTAALVARDETRALRLADEHVIWINRVLELGLGALSAPA